MIGPKTPKLTARESKQGYERAAGRSFNECEGCGQSAAAQMHHRLHRSHGGDERVGNLLHLCPDCHRRAHHDSDRYSNGWSVFSGFDPERIPLLYRGQWMYLTDDGGLQDGGDAGENSVHQT